MDAGSRVFGPVPSRRLGFSLGVDVVPYKTCTLDCIYCQLGPTTARTLKREGFVPVGEVLAEVQGALDKGGRIDWITFSGSGEPTLSLRLGEMIRRIKEMTAIPVAVLTNGTLFSDPAVRGELLAADLVVPSLDAGTEKTFRKVNRPHPDISLEKMVRGMADFSSEFKGKIWLEVMLVKGVNDSEVELEEMARKIQRIKPEKVQLNTVVRPPAAEAEALSPEEMEKSRSFLQTRLGEIPVEVVTEFRGEREKAVEKDVREAILTYLRRRPATLQDLSAALGLHRNQVIKYLALLLEEGEVRSVFRGSDKYFLLKD